MLKSLLILKSAELTETSTTQKKGAENFFFIKRLLLDAPLELCLSIVVLQLE